MFTLMKADTTYEQISKQTKTAELLWETNKEINSTKKKKKEKKKDKTNLKIKQNKIKNQLKWNKMIRKRWGEKSKWNNSSFDNYKATSIFTSNKKGP